MHVVGALRLIAATNGPNVHSRAHLQAHAQGLAKMYTYIHTYARTCIHSNIHIYMHTHANANMHTYIHAIHTCIHPLTKTCIQEVHTRELSRARAHGFMFYTCLYAGPLVRQKVVL